MNSLIHEFTMLARDGDGHVYRARCYGRERRDGTWIGWLEFVAVGADRTLRTERETTQSSREHVWYWATGLEPYYLQGAFARACHLGAAAHLSA